MKITCVIPARLFSTRFPRKMVAPLLGKPLLEWVWRSAVALPLFDRVVIAVDDEETLEIARRFGAEALLTPKEITSGTMRVAHLYEQGEIEGDIFVNWQGDEPLVSPKMIEDLLQSCGKDEADVWTLKKKITDPTSTHIAKVITDARGHALYFSRAPIPFFRDKSVEIPIYKHIGIYAYTPSALLEIASFTPSDLERVESLEQLTFLYHGLAVKVHETEEEAIGVDLPEHLAQVEAILASQMKVEV